MLYRRPANQYENDFSMTNKVHNTNLMLVSNLSFITFDETAVERLFLSMPRGCLQFVIVVFPDHTHLLFLFIFIYTIVIEGDKFCFES